MVTFGRYEVERELGTGAMGVVYLARDPRLERHVALKVIRLPAGLGAEETETYRKRFLREAQAAAALSHPGVVTVYDAEHDADDHAPYIAMEFVEGRSLRDVLDTEGPIEPGRASSLVGEVADALGGAHRAGIVHRDVKPANLLLRDLDDKIKVADFGVARIPASELTRTNTAVGSPAYMSPEQIRSREVDGRSDLFSLAIVLYEALCGRKPFTGEDASEVAYSVVHETPVPITRRAEGLPVGLDAFFERALAKDPEARFPDAAAFREALDRAAASRSSPPTEATVVLPATTSPRRWTRWAGVAALVVLPALLWLIFGGPEDAHLRLDAKNSFREATLQLLVDGEQVYERDLSAPEQPAGTLGKLKGLIGVGNETFETWIRVDPGKHEIVALVHPTEGSARYADTIVVELEPGDRRRLKLAAISKKSGGTVALKLD